MADLDAIRTDLAAEHDALDALVAPLGTEWDLPTPAAPWTIRDQISHLAFFDEQASLAATDPDRFGRLLQSIAADVEGFMQAPLDRGREMEASEVLQWWRSARGAMLAAFETLQPGTRVPWYGPPMSPASFMSARLMETWAHGQDVADALGVEREATARLRHVAFLGYRARANSYAARGRAMPPGDVRVELGAPDGQTWAWGESATDRVHGPALDFCLVVTQRRHRADTDLLAEGDLAVEWMDIAQVFAGPPGEGRKPGQFPRSP